MAHSDKDPSGANAYGRDKRAVVGAVATLLASGAIGLAVWAHAKLLDHETRLVRAEANADAEVKMRQAIQSQLDQRLQRIEDKQDRMLDRLQVAVSPRGN